MSENKVTFPERESIYRMAVEKYGADIQCIVALEELSEVQKEICKFFRGFLDLGRLAEEVADATICLEQIRLMFDINDMVCSAMDAKVDRLLHRILEGDHEQR